MKFTATWFCWQPKNEGIYSCRFHLNDENRIYHRNVNEIRSLRYLAVRWPSASRTTSIFLGVIPCFQPYLDSPDIMSSDRRGNGTETCAVYSLLLFLVGLRNSITTSLPNDNEINAFANALWVSTCGGIPENYRVFEIYCLFTEENWDLNIEWVGGISTLSRLIFIDCQLMRWFIEHVICLFITKSVP